MPHGGWVHAKSRSDRGVRFALVHPGSDESRQVERREAVAFLVLGNLGIGVRRCIAHDHGHFNEPCPPGGTQSLGTKVDSVTPSRVGGADDDGLQDAVSANVVGKLFDLRLREFGTWIVRVFIYLSQGDDERTSVVACACKRR